MKIKRNLLLCIIYLVYSQNTSCMLSTRLARLAAKNYQRRLNLQQCLKIQHTRKMHNLPNVALNITPLPLLILVAGMQVSQSLLAIADLIDDHYLSKNNAAANQASVPDTILLASNKLPLELDKLLHQACIQGNPQTIEELIKKGANIHIKNELGFDALSLACKYNHVSAVESLLRSGARPQWQQQTIETQQLDNDDKALYVAAEYGHDKTVEVLLRHNAPVNQACDTFTPLIKASDCGHLKAVELLLQYKALTDVQDKQGATALHYAVYRKFYEIARKLIAANASITITDNGDYSPVDIAHDYRNKKMLDIITKNYNDNYPVGRTQGWDMQESIQTISKRVHQLTKMLMDAHYKKHTQLIQASYRGNLQSVQEYLKNGSSPDLQDENGNTALHYAVYKSYYKIAQALIAANAQPTIFNKQGFTAIDLAYEYENKEMLRILTKQDTSTK